MSQTYNAVNDVDPIETKEWVDAIRSVVENEGVERARFLLEQLLGTSKNEGVNVPAGITFIFLHNVLSLSLFAINAAKIMFLCNSYKLNPLNCVIVFLASLEFYRQFRIDLSACKIVRHGVLLS